MNVGSREGTRKEKTSVVAVNAAAGNWVEATKVDTVIENFM